MTESNGAIVALRDVSKSFDTTRALRGVSLEVRRGEIFGLVGPDGAGKTTLMRILAGIMEPDSGEALVLGRDVVRDADAIKDDVAYMSQRFGLYPDLTVLENLDFYADLYGEPRRGREVKIERLLAFSNMAPFRHRRAGKLSGGMKQKLGLACALIHSPKLLLLDEPTNGVDPLSRRDFWHILSELLASGVTIIVSTAYLDEAERCTRVALLHAGKVEACDTPEAIKRLMPGATLEIRTAATRRTAAILRRSITDPIVVFGDRVNILARDAAAVTSEVKRLLAAESIEVESIRPVTATLENVFVSLLTDGSAQP